jgi:hypothetical protein
MRTVSGWLLLAGAGLLQSCAVGDCSTKDETRELLGSIEVPVAHADAGLPGELKLEEGEVLRRLKLSIRKGKMKVERIVEKEVGQLGAQFGLLEQEHAKRSGLEPFSGALVLAVDENGAAARGGLQVDDVVIRYMGKDVTSPDQLDHWVEESEPWQPAGLSVRRGAETIQVIVEVGSDPEQGSSRVIERALVTEDDRRRTGLELAEIPEDIRPLLVGPGHPEPGLIVVGVLPGGPAYFADIRVLDLVVSVDGAPPRDTAAYRDALDSKPSGSAVAFAIQRKDRALEKQIIVESDATGSSGFNILGLIKQEKKPERTEFAMIWGLLVDAQTCHSIKKEDDGLEYRTERSWGAVLDLLAWRETPKKSELRLLWFFPISFSRG